MCYVRKKCYELIIEVFIINKKNLCQNIVIQRDEKLDLIVRVT